MSDLAGKTALITGSSSGIGRAMALEFGEAGATVLVHCRENRKGMNEVVDSIRRAGGDAKGYCCDLSVPDELERFVDRVWEEDSPIDIWVNNAGVDVLTGDAASWSFDQKLDALWQLDVLATIRLSRMVGHRMKQVGGISGSKSVLNIGWDQVDWGMGGDSGEMFSTAKGAVTAFSRSLAKSLAPEVRVNCISPGWIKTSWGDQAPKRWQSRACRESLQQRWGTPEDVAHAARFLASPAAEFISGQTLHINGGFQHGGAS